MRARREGLVGISALLVGMSAAIAAEVAVGVLLYAGPGLVRSLTTVLTIELVAFGLGVWSAPAPSPDLIERLRRYWLLCLVSFVLAAFYGTSWTVLQDVGGTALGQGIGLAVLAGLPLYACGGVLGGLAVAVVHHPAGPRMGPWAPAALGAAAGFAVTGVLLPRSPMPSSLLVICVVLLSFAGMVFGVVVSARPYIMVKARHPMPTTEIRVEDRRASADRPASRHLYEGEHERRTSQIDEVTRAPWDVCVARALMPLPEQPWRVLLVGGGASSAPRSILHEHPSGRVDVLERQPAVVEMGRAHFETDLVVGSAGRVSVRVGNLDDLIDEMQDSYDLIVVDRAALAPLGGTAGLSARTRTALERMAAPAGLLAWGPDGTEAVPALPLDWSRAVYSRTDSDAGVAEQIEIVWPGIDRLLPLGFEGFAPSRAGAELP